MVGPARRAWPAVPSPSGAETPEDLLAQVARGSEAAFNKLCAVVAGPVFGVVRRVVRDVAQSEEVAQEALVELWRTAPYYRPDRGSALNWALTLAHRRAVDRVRSAQARTDREWRLAARSTEREFDQVLDVVIAWSEREQVRQYLSLLTDLQRESVILAYYGGHTYAEVAALLDVPLGTVKTRIRDGLIRLRDLLERPDGP